MKYEDDEKKSLTNIFTFMYFREASENKSVSCPCPSDIFLGISEYYIITLYRCGPCYIITLYRWGPCVGDVSIVSW